MSDAGPGPMPPHGIIDEFLREADRAALLDWAIQQQEAFKPAKIFSGDGGRETRVDAGRRSALRHRGLGPFEPLMRERLLSHLPTIIAAAGYRGPEPRSIEFELNAYGDGAHFAPHIDIPLGPNRRSAGEEEGEDRMISAVYYFFREPKSFTGGALRLYRFGADTIEGGAENKISLEPVQNRLIAFPSWARHEVDRVSCPSGLFQDHRFALNCWFCRKLDHAAGRG
jgi:SM-20-related protein